MKTLIDCTGVCNLQYYHVPAGTEVLKLKDGTGMANYAVRSITESTALIGGDKFTATHYYLWVPNNAVEVA